MVQIDFNNHICVRYTFTSFFAIKDRVFLENASNAPMQAIFDAFVANPSIRYIGFPTTESSRQDIMQNVKYEFNNTLSDCCIQIRTEAQSSDEAEFILYPLMFWSVQLPYSC